MDANLEAFRLKLVRYRARCLLMSHSLKAAKREIKTLTSSEGLVSITNCFEIDTIFDINF